MADDIVSDFGLHFLGYGFVKRDKKRLKNSARSFEEDIKNHSLLVRGLVFENRRADDFSGSYGNLITNTKVEGIGEVCFYKTRWPITNPQSKGTSDGYRIIFGLYKNDNDVFIYLPIFVYIAREENTYIQEGGKKIKITKSGIKQVIKVRLGH